MGIGAFARARGRRRAYYSPAMEAARPRRRGRRLRRGTVERPLNARLVRVGFLVVAPALLAFLFSISTTGALPRSTLDPLFDGESAATFAETLSAEYPSRVPGSEGAESGAGGTERRSGARPPDRGGRRGRRTSRTSVTSSSGTSSRWSRVARRRRSCSLLIATTPGAGSRSARTPRELRCSSSSRGASRPRSSARPVHRAHARPRVDGRGCVRRRGCSAVRSESPFARSAIAVVVLDGSTGAAARAWRSPATTGVAGAHARAHCGRPRRGQVGVTPRPSVPTQLVDLGVPFALDEQGRFLGRRALRRHADDRLGAPANDAPARRRSDGSASSGGRRRRSSAHSTPASAERSARPTASSSPTGPRAGGPYVSPSSSPSCRSLSESST